MTAVEGLVGWLEGCPSVGGAAVVGWRFEVVRGEGVRAGVRDSRLGGAYEGPGMASRLAGTLELHWSDGLVTRAGLDRKAIVDPATELDGWRADAVAERHGLLPPLAKPSGLPPVENFDRAVEDVVGGGAARCLAMLQELTERSKSAGVRRVDAVMRASRNERTVATSNGFRAVWQETSCSIDLWADEIVGASYGRRCLPTGEDLSRLSLDVSTLAPHMRSADTLPPTARGVLYTATVVEDLLGRLLMPNLAGRSIRDGRSPLSRADLEAGRQIVRADLDLTVDTTLPFELATAPCSSEGVSAGRVRLIADGRIASPTLDLATAAELGLPPTPVPRGRPTALLSSSVPEIDPAEALAVLGDGVVVRDLPGLHTQQARRSTYALVVPDAQVVAGGEAKGRCSVRVAGGLLGHLSQPSTRLVRIDGDLSVGLLVLSGVEVLPA